MPIGKLIRIPPDINDLQTDYEQSNLILDKYIKLIAEGEQTIKEMKKEKDQLVGHINILDKKREKEKDSLFVQQFTNPPIKQFTNSKKRNWNYSGAFWRDADVAQANA